MRELVRRFLLDFKKAVEEGGIYLIRRHGCVETLRHLQLTKANLQEELLGLTVDDYSSGPERDREGSGNLWIFGKLVCGQEIYIKVKLITDPAGKTWAKCIAFHISKHPIRYPLRARRKKEGQS